LFRPRERAFKQFKCPRPQCVKQYKNVNNEKLHFKNDVRKQEQAKPDRQRNVKSVKRMVAVKPKKKNLVLKGNNKEWNNDIIFGYKFSRKYHFKIQSNIYFI